MARTPEQVFDDHLAAIGTGDLDKIAADYSEDAVFVTPAKVGRGRSGVKEGFAQLFTELAAAGEIKGLEVPVRVFADDILYIEWWADLGSKRCDGVDTFVFRDGEIRAQTVKHAIT